MLWYIAKENAAGSFESAVLLIDGAFWAGVQF
jgi:hypothetical protein